MNHIMNLITYTVRILSHEATQFSASLAGPWGQIRSDCLTGATGEVVDITPDHDGSDLLVVKLAGANPPRYARFTPDELEVIQPES